MDPKYFVIIFLVNYIECQSDGGFWWLNKDLMNGAKESREIKSYNLNSKVRTLPPKYKIESTTTSDYDDDEDREMYKYGNDPDCVCEKRELCDQSGYLITDGTGIINERYNKSLSIAQQNSSFCLFASLFRLVHVHVKSTQLAEFYNVLTVRNVSKKFARFNDSICSS